MPSRIEKDEAISTWRKAHVDELDKTLGVMKSIRDDPEAKDKDKIDAGLAIARLLGAVASDGRTVKPVGPDTNRPQHRGTVRANIDKWLDAID